MSDYTYYKDIDKKEESLKDQANYLYTASKVDPKYRDKITDIELGTTQKGEEKLTFKADGKDVLVLEYPKPKNKFYYYVDGVKQGHIGSVAHIIEKLIEGYTLKGSRDGEVFDISYNEDESKLEKFKNEIQPAHEDIFMYIVEENKKLEEASRNELLAKTKGETISRYNRAAGYKGFSIVDIDTDSILTTNSLRVTCRVGKYYDTVQMEDILYWIQMYAEQQSNKWQVNTKVITQAIMDSIDGMDIKVDCECGDFKYRFAYQATVWGYKYGKPENRPAKITNPNGFGALCKHLTAMLSNKKWLQQVTGTVMDWMVERLEEVNRFLKVKEGEELTLPNELARQNAKKAFYSKLFNKDDEEEQEEENNEEDTEQSIDNEEEVELQDVDNNNEEENNEEENK